METAGDLLQQICPGIHFIYRNTVVDSLKINTHAAAPFSQHKTGNCVIFAATLVTLAAGLASDWGPTSASMKCLCNKQLINNFTKWEKSLKEIQSFHEEPCLLITELESVTHAWRCPQAKNVTSHRVSSAAAGTMQVQRSKHIHCSSSEDTHMLRSRKSWSTVLLQMSVIFLTATSLEAPGHQKHGTLCSSCIHLFFFFKSWLKVKHASNDLSTFKHHCQESERFNKHLITETAYRLAFSAHVSVCANKILYLHKLAFYANKLANKLVFLSTRQNFCAQVSIFVQTS